MAKRSTAAKAPRKVKAPDLTVRPPRSARVRLGGYAILPRMLDKGRAEIAGVSGEYHYNCPLDQHLVRFAGFNPAALKAELAKGKSDTEILAWIQKHSKHRREVWEIEAWSHYQDKRGPTDLESREYFNGYLAKLTTEREDIVSWFDVLDVDDHVSYGGLA